MKDAAQTFAGVRNQYNTLITIKNNDMRTSIILYEYYNECVQSEFDKLDSIARSHF